MDYVIVANAWAAGIDNPTSKHRIALDLARRGHRVLWIEGAGMRAPSVASGSDRLRMARKVLTALKGARRVKGGRSEVRSQRSEVGGQRSEVGGQRSEVGGQRSEVGGQRSEVRGQGSEVGGQGSEVRGERGKVNHEPLTILPSGPLSLWVLSPLFIPMPKYESVRQLNGVIGAWSARLWCFLLGFRHPVLINYVPVLAEIMRRWRRVQTTDCRPQTADCRPQTTDFRPQTADRSPQTEDQGHAASGVEPATSEGREPQGLRSAVCSLRSNSAARVVYHCVDRWDAFAMYDSAVMAAMDRRCCEYADVVIASAAELRDRCLRWNPNTHLVTHGVDYAHFASSFMSSITSEPSTLNHAPLTIPPEPSTLNHEPLTVNHEPFPLNPLPSRPPDLPAGPIIGFFGLLSEWVDQALLLRLARALPQAHVVLIGKADVDVAALKGVSNIHVLGPRLFTALPAYLAHFTVGIIPFVVNDLTRAVNPIKLREMLSGGCPVVSSALPEVAACVEQVQVGGAVVVAETAEAFEAGVRRFVEAPLDLAARRALSERMRGETWEAKVDEILKIVGPGPADGSADRSG